MRIICKLESQHLYTEYMRSKRDYTLELTEVSLRIGYIIAAAFFIFALGSGNFIQSAMIDYGIAEALGGVKTIPQNNGIWSGGQSFGGISWTFSSVVGILMTTLTPAVGLITGIIASGVFSGWLLHNFTFGKSKPLGRYNWLVWVNILFWIMKFPVPLEYSLFYWTAIRF